MLFDGFVADQYRSELYKWCRIYSKRVIVTNVSHILHITECFFCGFIYKIFKMFCILRKEKGWRRPKNLQASRFIAVV
jgi:hypothetical protein